VKEIKEIPPPTTSIGLGENSDKFPVLLEGTSRGVPPQVLLDIKKWMDSLVQYPEGGGDFTVNLKEECKPHQTNVTFEITTSKKNGHFYYRGLDDNNPSIRHEEISDQDTGRHGHVWYFSINPRQSAEAGVCFSKKKREIGL